MSSENQQCVICCNDLTYRTLTPCNHDDVCGVCHLRLRYLLNDTKCPMCKQPNEQLIVDLASEAKPNFEAYPIWGNELGQEFRWREDVGMFFPTQYYEQDIVPLFGYHCTTCDDYDGSTPDPTAEEEEQGGQNKKKRGRRKKPITPIRGLQDHLRTKHRLTLCNLCVENKRDFVSQLPRWTPSQLQQHLSKGDGVGSGFTGHPMCRFCRPKRFYDLQQLYVHLAKEHFKCHVCEKQGLQNQYFRNYASLEKHFDAQHFLCHDPVCLEQKFVVFENEIDLRAHELSMHGTTTGGSTKINLHFQYRRPGATDNATRYANQEVPSNQDFQYGLDGQVFDPEAAEEAARPQGEAEPNEETAHPLHLLRTQEIRAAALAIRESQGLTSQRQQEAFPSLGSGAAATTEAATAPNNNNNNNAIRMGWTSEATRNKIRKPGGLQANDREAFPSLPTTNNTKKKKNPAALTVLRPTATARAMRAAANAPNNWSSRAATAGRGGSAAAASTAAAAAPSMATATMSSSTNRASNLTTDNFPSLGGGSSSGDRSSYQAAENYARQHRNNTANLAASNFPSLGGGTTTTARVAAYPPRSAAAQSIPKKKPPPQTTSAQQFPGLPTSTSSSNSVRNKVLASKSSTTEAATSLQQGMTSVSDIKLTLGTEKFKQLKNATKEFASGNSTPEAYVDIAASIFPHGYLDGNFWTFLPSLITSSPANPTDTNRALRYMDDMRMVAGTQASMSSLGGPVASNTNTLSSLKKAPQPKKNAWGSGGGARSKQQPNKSKANNNNKKKMKQRDELRALAGFR